MTRYFVAPDAGGDLYVWREERGLEHRPEPVVARRDVPDPLLWARLTGDMYDEGGLPVHLPMGVTADGQGPTEPDEPHHRECWCSDADCFWTQALSAERAAGRITLPEVRNP